MKKLENARRVELSISRFPCLKKYAQYLKQNAQPLRYETEDEIYWSIPYYHILAVDPFWKSIFGSVGFHYDLALEMFVFWTLEPDESSLKIYFPSASSRALKFIQELKKRNFL